jgi:hypothetical protein
MPLTWEELTKFAEEKKLPPLTPEMQEYKDSAPSFILEQRIDFVSQTMDLHDTCEEANPYPFDLEPGILQMVIWHRAGKEPQTWLDPREKGLVILNPHENFMTYFDIEIECSYLFLKPCKFKSRSKERIEFFLTVRASRN